VRRKLGRVAGVLAIVVAGVLGGNALYQSGHVVVGVAVAALGLLVGILAFAPASPSAGERAHSEVWGQPMKPQGFDRPRDGRDPL
jgi:hypothetical protein